MLSVVLYTHTITQVAYAEYELDAIMLTGSCTDYSPGKQLPPPKGLQLHLGTQQTPHMVRLGAQVCGADARAGLTYFCWMRSP